MRRALCGAVGVLAAAVAVVPAPSASAKFPALRQQGQQPQTQSVVYEQNIVLSEAHHRLEEMKVELALLSDVATFPFYLGGRATGQYLELRGYVPNETVRQRAVEVARRSTVLTVVDSLKIEPNMSLRPSRRPARELQRDGAELLHRNLGESADQLSLGVRPGGIIVVGGPIASVEAKLAVSRLFRPLSGCFGVVNEMTVEPILRDGQRLVQVTQDGSMAVPPLALGIGAEPIVASSPASAMPMPIMPVPATVASIPPVSAPSPYMPTPVRKAPQPSKFAAEMSSTPAVPGKTAMPSPQQLSMQRLQVAKQDSRMPSAVPPKPETKKKDSSPDALTAPKLPVKWGQSTASLDTQVKKLEKVNTPPIPSTPRSSGDEAKMPKPGRTPKPPEMPRLTSTTAHASKNSRDAAKEASLMPSAVPTKPETEKKSSTRDALAESKPKNAGKNTSPSFADTRVAPTPAMTWKRPGGEEGSEPKALSAPKATGSLSSASAKPKPPATPPSQPHRWPPAYAPKTEGSPGIIVFED